MLVDESVKKKVLKGIDKRRDELIDILVKLVRIPSVVGYEGKAQRAVSQLYRNAGLKVVRFQADRNKIVQHEAFVESNLPYKNRPNIIGVKPGDKGSRSLILNGHIDVVSPEPIDQWTYDPWGAKIANGKLYGRGSADMKGGLAANFMALKTLLELGLNPKGKVMLQSVIEEEAGGGPGTLACLLAGYTADGLVITEPHSLRITVAMAGVNYFRVKVHGKTAHAGLAHLGVNAIGKMYRIYDALAALDQKRGAEVKFDLFEKGSGRSTHLNIGTMKAGDWASTVAGAAEIECRISFIPGEKMKSIKATVEKTIFDAVKDDPWMQEHPPVIDWYGWHAEPWLQNTNSPFVKTFKQTAEDVLGREVEFAGRAAGLDSRFASYFNMPALCSGPIGYALHGLDECVDLESLIQLTKVLALFILDWCGLEA
jgi:acetylornithine deacetylase